jgi:hypothetical protein
MGTLHALTLFSSSGYYFRMKRARLLFAAGVLWELLRFGVFLYVTAGLRLQIALTDAGSLLMLMLFGGSQLVIPAAYILLFIDEKKYSQYVQLLRIGKALAVFTAFLVIVKELFIDRGFFYMNLALFSGMRYLLFVLIGIFFDLIFLYFLLSYRVSKDNDCLDTSKNGAGLPGDTETVVSTNENDDREE